MNIMEQQWANFLKLVGLDENKMPVDQRRETKRAFYGGAAHVFKLTETFGNITEDQAMAIMDSLNNEIGAFWENENRKQNYNPEPKAAEPSNDGDAVWVNDLELQIGTVFLNKNMPDHEFKIMYADKVTNVLVVEITPPGKEKQHVQKAREEARQHRRVFCYPSSAADERYFKTGFHTWLTKVPQTETWTQMVFRLVHERNQGGKTLKYCFFNTYHQRVFLTKGFEDWAKKTTTQIRALICTIVEPGERQKWTEDGWNYQHTQFAFERGEYYLKPKP